jgi:hypothetical protein
MKKYILGGIAAVAIAAVAVTNVNLGAKGNDLSDVSLANVEALATENGITVAVCLGLWGECVTPSGIISKAPAVEANF